MNSEEMARDQILEILSDAQIVAPVVRMGELHSDINPKSFFYCFTHQSTYGDYPVSQGTVHGEELPYIFGAPLVGGFNHFGTNYTHDEVFLSELVMTLWTNFAKTGDPNLPTPQNYTIQPDQRWLENLKTLWPPYEKQIQRYLHIDMDVVSKDHYRAQKMALWNRLVPDLILSRPITESPTDIPWATRPPVTFTFVPTIRPSMPIPFTDFPTIRPAPPKPKPSMKSPPRIYTHDETMPPDTEPSPTPPTYAGTPISIVILVGICILFINCCAMGVVYYQRDKIKYQSNLLKKTFFSRKTDDSEERVSDAPSSSAMKERKHRKRENKSDYEVSDEIHSESGSRASGVSRTSGVSKESASRRKHSQSTQESSSKQETPKSSLKSKSSKDGHKRHKSENSIYSEIGRTAEVHVHAEASGPLKSSLRKNPSVKFNTIGGGLPPKSVTKSTTSITSKASVRSNVSRASVKSTTSRSSVKSTTSEKRLKKNASCQSLPTAEYSWGITPEMTMTQRDDPEGRDDQRSPVDRQQTLATMQKLHCPKVLPDHPDGIHSATLPKMRPPPPPRSTSLTAKDLQELEENVHVVYRKKRTPRRDASTDSCDLSGMDNIYGMGVDNVPTSMYGAPAATATVNRARTRKSDGAADYGRTGSTTEYIRSAKSADYGRQIASPEYGRMGGSGGYTHQGTGPAYSGYMPYESSYACKESSNPSAPRTPTTPTAADETKTFASYSGGLRTPRGPLATFGKTTTHSPTNESVQEQPRPHPANNSTSASPPVPNTAAVVTAAAQTALATVTAPAFVGASSPGRSGTSCSTSSAAPSHSAAIHQQESTASSSDTATVYEQSENTGTIKRKKSVKKDNEVKTVVIHEPYDKPYDKPLKGVLKQTSAYDKPKPIMAKAPGASPSASASSLSSATSTDVGSGASGSSEVVVQGILQKTSSLKRSNVRPATPGTKHKTKHDNHTSTTVAHVKLPE